MSLIGTPNTLDNALRPHVALFFFTRAEPEVAADVEIEVLPFTDVTKSREKPLVSARFSRKAAKPSPDGNNIGHTLLHSSAQLKILQKLKL
jgi:hypothetical protein